VRRAALTLALLSGLAGPAGAQVAAPSLVDEDLPAEEKRQPAPNPPAPPPPPPARQLPPEPPRLRAIEPVRSTWADVLSAWRDRRAALREQQGGRAAEAARRLLDLRRELAIENMHAFAASEAREADRALRERLPAEAVEYAELAVQLAPDLGNAWVALARARIAKDPSRLGPALAAAWAAARAALREPHTVRAFLGDVIAAAMAALAAAGALTLLLLFLRRARLFLHDFAHLPVVRAATRLQAFFLALVLLGLPLALGLGPWLALFGATLGGWLYYSGRERLVAAAALAGLSLLPLGAASGARLTAWTGSLAEEVFELEHGADGGERAARLAVRADLPPPAFLALGRWHKRRGDLEAAMRWYDRASEVGGRSVELMVNIGNVKFLRGDVEGAKTAWLDAADRGSADVTALAAAHYNLAKLYLRQSALDQSNQARRRAQQMDEEFITRFGSDDDFRANRWILDVPVEHGQIQALAAADGTPRLAGEAVQSRLGGAIPRWLWPLGPLGLVASSGSRRRWRHGPGSASPATAAGARPARAANRSPARSAASASTSSCARASSTPATSSARRFRCGATNASTAGPGASWRSSRAAAGTSGAESRWPASSSSWASVSPPSCSSSGAASSRPRTLRPTSSGARSSPSGRSPSSSTRSPSATPSGRTDRWRSRARSRTSASPRSSSSSGSRRRAACSISSLATRPSTS
jgi:hypothetical protein